jgi:hypothetical protein
LELEPLINTLKAQLITQMKKLGLILFFGLTSVYTFGQSVDKLITKKNVTRIIKTLTADDMMGRSASKPEHIEKATAFIESEFKKIGLSNLKGLTTYRQEFTKSRILPGSQQVTIDGKEVNSENMLIITEKPELSLSSGLPIKQIAFDSTASNKDQYFFDKAFALIRDTSSMLVLIDSRFQHNFQELKGYFTGRFTNNRKYTKVFVTGVAEVNQYTIKAIQKIETIKMANLVGILPGKSKPDEMVVFSGHYDHIGIEKPINGDSIANGADDDASGTTAVIELARYFKKIKNNERTLIFVAFTAEEIGGFGSKYFSEQLNPDKVVAMFNIEMIGKPSKWGQNFAFITGYERSDFGEILQKNLTGTQFEFRPDPYPEQNLFYRSDNATLARLGVPAHTISTDEIDIDKFYHTVDDEIETLNMNNLTTTIRAIALSSKSIVAGVDTPKRIDKATVR